MSPRQIALSARNEVATKPAIRQQSLAQIVTKVLSEHQSHEQGRGSASVEPTSTKANSIMQKYQPLKNSEVIKIAESFYSIEKDDIGLENAGKQSTLNKKHSGLMAQRKNQ